MLKLYIKLDGIVYIHYPENMDEAMTAYRMAKRRNREVVLCNGNEKLFGEGPWCKTWNIPSAPKQMQIAKH